MDPELRRQAAILYRSGALQEARAVLTEACGDGGTDPQAWTLLARVQRDLGDLAAALRCTRQALALQPGSAEASCVAGTIAQRLGDLDGAAGSYRRAIALAPGVAEPRFHLGEVLLRRGDVGGAIAELRATLAIEPGHVASLNNLALALQGTGQGGPEAVQLLKRAHGLRPDDVAIRRNLAGVLIARGRAGEVVDLMEPAVADDARGFDDHRLLADGYLALGRFNDALASLDRALSLRPGDEGAVAAKAEILERRSDVDGALALLAPYLAQGAPGARTVLVFAALSSRLGRQGEAIARLESLLEKGGQDAPTRINVLYELGRLCDEMGDYNRAFGWYTQANAATLQAAGRPEGGRVRGRDREIVSGLIARHGRDDWEGLPASGEDSEVPVFVVGMPRTGTTLVEQIIASHPQAAGAGELSYFPHVATQLAQRLGGRVPYPECLFGVNGPLLGEIAAGYLAQLAEVDRSAQRVVDKMPYNYLHLGLIARVLPGARVIHTTRDPMDTCLSIYFNKFNRFIPGANDLVEIAHGYRLHCRLMEYWKRVLALPILAVSYESLVGDPEGETHRLIEFCGLEWSDQCLRFHEQRRDVATPTYQQVQKKIYTSAVGRWRNYEKHLAPLRAALDLPDP